MGYTDEELNHHAQTLLGPNEQSQADKLADRIRMQFIQCWALRSNLELYKTDTERDWAYIVRREYRYVVLMRSWADAGFFCSVAQCFAVAHAKQVRWWPWLAFPLLGYFWAPYRFKQNNRRLFEMLNVGSEFELGAERNRVLEECNRIAQRADY